MDTETPIHKLKQQLHGEKCSALLEAYILTGCDETSKIGSEVPAMAILKILVLNIWEIPALFELKGILWEWSFPNRIAKHSTM